MPLRVFHNQNKKAKLVIVSHNTLLGVRGIFKRVRGMISKCLLSFYEF